MSLRLAALLLLASASAVRAQVIYEPVTVQHGGQNPYYYAGSDPAIHAAARFPRADGANWGRTNGYAFVSPTRAVAERRTRVFTDAFGTADAGRYGLTPDAVVNEANARLPKYIRKADLLEAGEVREGIRIVPPTATAPPPAAARGLIVPPGGILIRPSTPGLNGRGPVFVFPRGMLDRKVSDVAGLKTMRA